MIKIKIKINNEKMIGGAADYMPDDYFDPYVLKKGVEKEIGDHGLDADRAKEVAKDELILEPEKYTKEVTKNNKLSKYWKKRAKRRALKAGRKPRNGIDRKWALDQQEKSSKINNTIKKVFRNTLEMTEEIEGTIQEIIKRMKEAKFQKTTPKDLANRQKPPKPAKQKKGENNPISGKVRRSRYAVGPAGSFGPA